jgi:glycosyltransferase involved in cell wall biosynthesis
MNALVSVIIPSRSRPSMLREAVESVVAQTYRPVEIIVVLTGADAETTATAYSLGEAYGVRVVATPPYNLATSRNNGMRIAKGEWITFLDDDDLYTKTKLQRQVEAAELTKAGVITNSWIRFNEFGPTEDWISHPDKHLPDGLTYPEALTIGNFMSNGLLVKADIMKELGGFDGKLDACEDWDMWRRISHRYEIVYIDEPMVHIRVHGNNMSSRRWLMTSTALRHLIKMHFDTPERLRHMLPRARAETLKRLFPVVHVTDLPGKAYEGINGISGGRIRSWVRAIRRTNESAS